MPCRKPAELSRMLSEIRSGERPVRVDSDMEPDFWVEPRYVIPVTADEITRSPNHTAGRDDSGKGYALRFPRMVEMPRIDKRPEDSTTVEEIVRLYGMQKTVKTG